jgi:hypothetical protein
MLKLMNMPLNKAEVKILIASANKSRTGELNPDEFLDLIFNEHNILNMDLKQVNFDIEGINDEEHQKVITNLMQNDAE